MEKKKIVFRLKLYMKDRLHSVNKVVPPPSSLSLSHDASVHLVNLMIEKCSLQQAGLGGARCILYLWIGLVGS